MHEPQPQKDVSRAAQADDYIGINRIIDNALALFPDAGITQADHALRTAVIDAYELGKRVAAQPQKERTGEK